MDTVASLLWLDVPILNPSSAPVLIRALFLFFFFSPQTMLLYHLSPQDSEPLYRPFIFTGL